MGYIVSLCSLYFYDMKCRVFNDTNREALEKDINSFIRDKDDVKISFSTSERGYHFQYSAIVY